MDSCSTDSDAQRDLAAMERWAAWVYELMHHAAAEAEHISDRRVLEGAAEDAVSLKHALVAAGGGWLDAGQTAILRSIYELWDANQGRHERLAAEVDAEFHHRWTMRSALARLRSDGTPLRGQLAEVS